MANPAWWVIAKREFGTRVKSKWFAITTLLGPVLMIALLAVPVLLAQAGSKKQFSVDVVAHCDADVSAAVMAAMTAINPNLKLRVAPESTTDEQLVARIREEKIDGYLVLPRGLLDDAQPQYFGANTTNMGFVRSMESGITGAVVAARAQSFGLQDDQLAKLARRVKLDAVPEMGTGSGTGKGGSGTAAFILGYIVAMLLYMSILLYAVNVMRSVLEEKTNRVVELIASSTPSSQLMAGKIGGVGSVGLLQLGVWTAVAGVLFRYREAVLSFFGLPDNIPIELPAAGLATIFVILIYFLLGFFFFSAIYAAIGAMCSTDQEAQQAQIPVVMFLIIPLMCLQVVGNDPRGELTSLLTQIPFASPILMPMRYLLGGADLGDVALSIAILIASLGLVLLVAGRIYRVGILMYGKRPTLRELTRWIGYS